MGYKRGFSLNFRGDSAFFKENFQKRVFEIEARVLKTEVFEFSKKKKSFSGLGLKGAKDSLFSSGELFVSFPFPKISRSCKHFVETESIVKV